MPVDIQKLNKAFESRIRLGIMSMLMVNEWLDFAAIKETLDLTDGNLASHIGALEKSAYIQVKKQFVGKKPNTQYAATEAGRHAFKAHLKALENLLKENR